VEGRITVPQVGEVVAEEHTGASIQYDRGKLDQANSVGEVLDSGPGADVRNFGAPGSYSTLSLRGADSDQVAVYLDGMLLNQASGGGVDLSDIELAHAETITVYRGTTPVQLGHALPGGSVNIQTPRPGGEPRGRIKAEMGSFGERGLSAMGLGQAGKWELLGAVTTRRAKNHFVYTDDRGTELNTADDREVHRKNAQVRQSSALAKVGRALPGGSRMDGFVRYLDKRQGLPTATNADVDTRLDTQRAQSRLRLEDRSLFGLGRLAGMAAIHGKLREEVFDDRDNAVGLESQHNRYRTRAVGLSGYVEWLGDQHSAILRTDASEERYVARNLLSDRTVTEAQRVRVELAASHKAHLFQRRFLVSTTVRHRRVTDSAEVIDSGIGSTAADRDVQHHWTTGELGLRWKAGGGWSLRANVAEYVRTPSFYELFGDRGLVAGNSDLEAERGINSDIGVAWQGRWYRRWLPRAELSVTAFRNRVDSMIVRTFSARGVGQAENIGHARLIGVEAAARLDLSSALRLEAQGTVQETENRSGISGFEGKQLPGVPGYTYGTALRYERENWSLFHELDVEGDRYYDSANLLKAEDQVVHNAGGSVSLGNWKLRITGRNLTDDNYEDFNGYPRPGRSWRAELIYGGVE